MDKFFSLLLEQRRHWFGGATAGGGDGFSVSIQIERGANSLGMVRDPRNETSHTDGADLPLSENLFFII